MKEPVDHILRPQLPWRRDDDGAVTECGYDASKVSTISRGEFFQRLKDLGQQRTAMITCMTCSNTARRWGTWDDDPRLALQREIEWECRGTFYPALNGRGHRLHDELVAIQRLIDAHPDQFSALMHEIGERRAWNDRKAKMATPIKGRPRSVL